MSSSVGPGSIVHAISMYSGDESGNVQQMDISKGNHSFFSVFEAAHLLVMITRIPEGSET